MEITFNDYSKFCLNKLNPEVLEWDDPQKRLMLLALGLTGEAIELLETVNHKMEEGGDVLFYAALIHHLYASNIRIEFPPEHHEIQGQHTGSFYVEAILSHVGRISEHAKKHAGHGHPLNPYLISMETELLLKALHRWAWYCAGIHVTDVARINMEKLGLRYPNGFSTKESLSHRDEQHG